jgi:phosphoribosyl 1,2-cyclic phosphodiesterase/CheY-like chemotaxis protein
VRVQFWGTRGSIATPGANTARYGGNTSCIEVRSARGTLVVIDCGTGGRALAQKLMADNAGRCGTILISHTHWDHIQGIPFFDPLYVPGYEWDVYGPKGLRESVREVLSGQMQYMYFPVSLDQCAANIRYHDLVEGSFAIDDIRVSARYLNHPTLTLGYRLQVDGATLVYACDHEPYSRILGLGEGRITGEDLRHADFMQGADLLIHDAQYTAQEYLEKMGWGHSPVEYVLKLAEHAAVQRVALTHHDPRRDDDALERLMAPIRRSTSVDVFAAYEGQVVELKGRPNTAPPDLSGELAEIPAEQEVASPLVLLRVANRDISGLICEGLQAESIRVRPLDNIHEAVISVAQEYPALAIIEHDPPGTDGIAICRSLRRQVPEHRLPVLLVAEREDINVNGTAGISDWLIKPFTLAQARTKVRTWLLRTAYKRMEGRTDAAEKGVSSIHRFVAAGAGKGRKLPRALERRDVQDRPGIDSDKAVLLWMYGREIADFDSPAFSKKLGQIIADATSNVRRKAS